MKKTLFLFLFFTLFSCKEKTYEEIEAEVLCDVLPEVAKYELNYSFHYLYPPPPPQAYGLDSLKLNQNQIDSINKDEIKRWKELRIENKKVINRMLLKLNEYKKVTFGVLDTLYPIKRLKSDENRYEFDSLEVRGLSEEEFAKSKLKINLVTRKNTFEGEDRNSDNPLLFLTRVLINKNKKVAKFSVYKYYGGYDVICVFSQKKQKWVVKEFIKEED
jgi:uncharacterized protein YfbU (UPF0304 family)